MNNEFTEYRDLVRALAHRWLATWNNRLNTESHSPTTIAIATPAAGLMLEDSPILYPHLVAGIKVLAELASSDPIGTPSLSDATGQCRRVYWPLVLHMHLAAFDQCYESLSRVQWSKCEDALESAVAPAMSVESFINHPPPPTQTAESLWLALCVSEHARLASRDVSYDVVDAVVGQVVATPGHEGALIDRSSHHDGSLDAWVYDELSGLHALANLAVLRRNRAWAKRVREIALYHLRNTQPDHTTSQPWGLFAFLWSPQTRMFADQQLHDVQAYTRRITTPSIPAPPLPDAVSALLLADAAATIARFDG